MAPWVGPFSPYSTWGGVRLPQERSASDPRDVCIPRRQGSDDCRSSRDGYRVHRSASANLIGGIPPFPPATGGQSIVQFRPPTCLDESDTALQQSPEPTLEPDLSLASTLSHLHPVSIRSVRDAQEPKQSCWPCLRKADMKDEGSKLGPHAKCPMSKPACVSCCIKLSLAS